MASWLERRTVLIIHIYHYRQSLIAHIDANNRLCGCDTDRWDRIRNKDLWTLSYYNDFCSRNGSEGLTIDFEERYDSEAKRIAICIGDRKEASYAE